MTEQRTIRVISTGKAVTAGEWARLDALGTVTTPFVAHGFSEAGDRGRYFRDNEEVNG